MRGVLQGLAAVALAMVFLLAGCASAHGLARVGGDRLNVDAAYSDPASATVSQGEMAVADAPATDRDVERALLDHIAESEGTSDQPGGGFYTSLAYGRWLPGGRERNLTALTLDEIDALQAGMLAQTANRKLYPGGGSSAIGRYQIVRKTLRWLRSELHLSGDELFDEAMQDRLALTLAKKRGASRGLGDEWASLKGAKLEKAIELAQTVFRPAS